MQPVKSSPAKVAHFLPLKYFFIFNINNHDLQDAANSPGDLAGSPVSLQAVLSAAVPRLPQHLRPRQGTAHAVHHGRPQHASIGQHHPVSIPNTVNSICSLHVNNGPRRV